MTMGIYCIQLEREKYWQSYVGISKNIEKRWEEHKRQLIGNYHHNIHLQNTWNRHQENDFKFYILEVIEDYDDLLKMEKEYGYAFGYSDDDLCFNIGTPGTVNGMLGRQMSEETKQRLSKINLGKKLSKETKLKMSESHKGAKNYFFQQQHSSETKEKISISRKGKNIGEQHHKACLKENEARFILTVLKQPKGKARDFIYKELASLFNVSLNCIQHIQKRNSWKYIEPLSSEEYESFKENLLNK